MLSLMFQIRTTVSVYFRYSSVLFWGKIVVLKMYLHTHILYEFIIQQEAINYHKLTAFFEELWLKWCLAASDLNSKHTLGCGKN